MHKEHLEKYLFHSECSTIMLLLLFSDWETQFFASVSALDHTSFRMCPLPGYAQSGVLMGVGVAIGRKWEEREQGSLWVKTLANDSRWAGSTQGGSWQQVAETKLLGVPSLGGSPPRPRHLARPGAGRVRASAVNEPLRCRVKGKHCGPEVRTSGTPTLHPPLLCIRGDLHAVSGHSCPHL